jgi:hypothetical protein
VENKRSIALIRKEFSALSSLFLHPRINHSNAGQHEYVLEIEYPELATKRTKALYPVKGYFDDWIKSEATTAAMRNANIAPTSAGILFY